jgi:hypothetical protein
MQKTSICCNLLKRAIVRGLLNTKHTSEDGLRKDKENMEGING